MEICVTLRQFCEWFKVPECKTSRRKGVHETYDTCRFVLNRTTILRLFYVYIKFRKRSKVVSATLRGRSSRWKGGGPNCWPMTGVPGGWPPGGGPGGRAPWRGLQGGRAPLRREILNFWTQFARFGAYFLPTSYWKSLDLFPIKVFFFFFFWIMQ